MKANFSFLFEPRSVAVVGASDNPRKLGYHVMKSLIEGGYPGKVFPVNPSKEEILGSPAHASLAQVPADVDLAIIVLPASMVLSQIKACASKGVRGVVLITAGFKEIEDTSGAELEAEIAHLATEAKIPIIGPNTFGFINLNTQLNASFTPEFSLLRKGGVTLISQSGGISHLLGFLAMRAGVGFSKIIGLGNRCNVDFADLLEWLGEDPETKVIAMYMEGVEDPRAFLMEASGLSRRKPMIIYKVGRSEVADRASLSHTGSLAGRHEVYQGAFHQAGILSVDCIEDLLDAAKALEGCPLPQGPNVAILSGQAGPAMAASDVCEDEGLKIVPFAVETQQNINELLPPLALRTNPVDMGPAWYDASAIKGIVKAVIEDECVDSILLFIMFASANVDALMGLGGVLEKWKQKKPLISCISAPPGIWDEEIRHLEETGAIVNFPTPERAAKALAYLWKAGKIQGVRKDLSR